MLVMQARPLLAIECCKHLPPDAQAAAPVGLANAAFFGGIGDMALRPVIGRMSDRLGLLPVLLFYLGIPALLRLAVALAPVPTLRHRMLYVENFVSQGFGTSSF